MTVLLCLVYLVFVCLGMSDSLFGAAWPAMRSELDLLVGLAGAVAMTECLGKFCASLSCNRLTQRLRLPGTALVGVLLIAAALLGLGLSPSFPCVILSALGLGLGAATIDVSLNVFVATHYQAREMSWLHCFWAVGATLGPAVMAWHIGGAGWRRGYFFTAAVLLGMALILVFTRSRWKKSRAPAEEPGPAADSAPPAAITNRAAFALAGVKRTLAAMFCYCGYEVSTGLWSASYLVERRGLALREAALYVSFYYGGITAGRFLIGFVAARLGSRALIRWGCLTALAGALILIPDLPISLSLAGLILIGLGAAPFYPMMIRETPPSFGFKNAQAVVGLQMASACLGATLLPPFFGVLAGWLSLAALPWFLLVLTAGSLYFSERPARPRRMEPEV